MQKNKPATGSQVVGETGPQVTSQAIGERRKVKRVLFHIGVHYSQNVMQSVDSDTHNVEMELYEEGGVMALKNERNKQDKFWPFSNIKEIDLLD